MARVDPISNGRSPEILRVVGWESLHWLRHGFSTRSGGVSRLLPEKPDTGELNLGFTASDNAAAVIENRNLFSRALLLSSGHGSAAAIPDKPFGMVTLKQMHSSLVRRVAALDAADRAVLWGDGLITREPGLLLGIQTADCLPVLVVDRKQHAVGAFHAGWRGTLKGIVERGIREMGTEFGSVPEDLTAAIGPGIGKCCFQVGAEVKRHFAAKFSYAEALFSWSDGLKLDLVEANRQQLLAAGVRAEEIHNLTECTRCRTDRFFSYRAEHGTTGRMMAAIGMLAE
ncbi:peptidoglycan editing factor PgeF [Acidisarcina polymorpha]|nr:peptidoglycan editing factor PgeF [Acidisarcina polymorpha]